MSLLTLICTLFLLFVVISWRIVYLQLESEIDVVELPE